MANPAQISFVFAPSYEVPKQQNSPRDNSLTSEAEPIRGKDGIWGHLRGIEQRIQASHDEALVLRAELAALIEPAVLAELERRAPRMHRPGDPIVISMNRGWLARGPERGEPIERHWREWLVKHHGGQLAEEMQRLARFADRVAELRAKILEVAGPERQAQFEQACDKTLQEELLGYWSRRWCEVRVLHLIAVFCDHEWCYRGWWLYLRENPASITGDSDRDARNLDGDWGWLRGVPAQVPRYCRLVLGPGEVIPESKLHDRGDDSFAGWFARRFPGGLPVRVGSYGGYHKPECFSWSGDELPPRVACSCGARPAWTEPETRDVADPVRAARPRRVRK